MTRKKTTEEFIEQAIVVHGARYDYSKVKYDGNKNKVNIVCNKHGVFSQLPNHHLKKIGCPKCGTESSANSRKLTKDDFLASAKKVHGGRYDYSLVKYRDTRTKIDIICEEHGVFQQMPASHIHQKSGCPVCRYVSSSNKQRYDLNNFIELAHSTHKGYYDYSEANYKDSKTPVIIICPEHGRFKQKPFKHLQGQGCKVCGINRLSDSLSLTAEDYFVKAKNCHGDYYDYSNSVFTRTKNKISIGCPEHGQFEQEAGAHILGTGCPKCGRLLANSKTSDSRDGFIGKSIEAHGDLYDYSAVEYKGSKSKVSIICKEHGVFHQMPNSHVRGVGCPRCTSQTSRAETELAGFVGRITKYLLELRAKPFGFELDIYIPDLCIALEFNGLYWHSSARDNSNNVKTRHKVKTDRCKEHGIRLIHIWEDDWVYRQDVVKKFLTNILSQNTERTFARKVNLTRIGYDEAKPFLDQNHIQGAVGATYHVGGYLNDVLVSVTSFKRRKNMTYELVRHSTTTKIVGILAKASQYALRIFADKIVSFCDLSMYTGQSYELAGYTLESTLPPDYKYVVRDRREHKFGFRHKQLKNKLPNYDPTLTEWENCRNHGMYRIYDCGKAKYVLTRQ